LLLLLLSSLLFHSLLSLPYSCNNNHDIIISINPWSFKRASGAASPGGLGVASPRKRGLCLHLVLKDVQSFIWLSSMMVDESERVQSGGQSWLCWRGSSLHEKVPKALSVALMTRCRCALLTIGSSSNNPHVWSLRYGICFENSFFWACAVPSLPKSNGV
jgi:hypothetical protein